MSDDGKYYVNVRRVSNGFMYDSMINPPHIDRSSYIETNLQELVSLIISAAGNVEEKRIMLKSELENISDGFRPLSSEELNELYKKLNKIERGMFYLEKEETKQKTS